MKGIYLKAMHNVFANVVKKLRVFSHLLFHNNVILTYSSLNAFGKSIVITALGGPERSAGSLGVVMNKRVLAACSIPELKRRGHYFLRDSSNWWNRIIKDKQCLETFERLTMTRS